MKKEQINFGGVPKEIRRGGGSKHIPEGEYEAKIVKVEKGWKDNDKSNPPYFRWHLQISAGEHKGAGPYSYITSLKPEALFNLRNLIHAVTEKNVAGKSLNFDPESLIGKKLGIVIQDREVVKDGKSSIYSDAVDIFPASELGDSDSDDEEETEEDDETEEEEDTDLEEVDLDEL